MVVWSQASCICCDFIEVCSKNIEVMFNLVVFEGKEMYVSVGPRVSAHNLSCLLYRRK